MQKKLFTMTRLLLLLVLLTATTTIANAHFLGHDSVDGGSLRYWRYTPYFYSEVNWADNQWSSLPGNMSIYSDNQPTGITLAIYDTNDSNLFWDGHYYSYHQIWINRHYTNTYTTDQVRALVTHEFGHALGLAHSYSGQIMNPCSTCSGVTTPQSHDRSDFDTLWN